jgi:hypothetical protein
LRTILDQREAGRHVDSTCVHRSTDAAFGADTLNDHERIVVDETDYVTIAGIRALLKTSDRRQPPITLYAIATGDGPIPSDQEMRGVFALLRLSAWD